MLAGAVAGDDQRAVDQRGAADVDVADDDHAHQRAGGLALGSVYEPISMFVCGATMVAVCVGLVVEDACCR